MLIFITVLMFIVWAISADDILSPNINILEELEKIKSIEIIMKSLETEMERLRTENKEQKENIRALETQLRDEMKKKNEEISNLTLGQVELRKENRGIFTAPLKGVYMFRVSVYGYGPTAASADIYKNGERVVSAYAYQAQNALNSSNGVVLILEVGDVVYVRLWAGRWIFESENNHNTFSGFLLFPLK